MSRVIWPDADKEPNLATKKHKKTLSHSIGEIRHGNMSKVNKVIYWISTLWLASGMLSTGILQLLKMKAAGAVSPPGVEGIIHLGYPVYFLTILGIWKILGVVALLAPKSPLLKEWAYAGFFFTMTGAIYSHLAVGDPLKEIFASTLLLVLTVVSWYLRPADRKIVQVPNLRTEHYDESN